MSNQSSHFKLCKAKRGHGAEKTRLVHDLWTYENDRTLLIITEESGINDADHDAKVAQNKIDIETTINRLKEITNG